MNGHGPAYTPSTSICTEPFSSKYTVEEDIGRGKFAVVRKCTKNATGELVAAKVIRKRRKGKSCREEILREVVMLELAHAHPRLVSLREVFETATELILVTEYCSGGELFQECVINESFKEDDVRRLLVQILEGLAYLHDNNIVHLDLKPQNILLTKPFPEGQVKICDLGFACLTNTGEDIREIIGTLDYQAPEVLDYEPLNIQTDMWSMGVLTYVMLTTCSPFTGDTPQETSCNITQAKVDFPEELFSDISELAQDFITKLLLKDPRDRLTARQCLHHEWLVDVAGSMDVSVPSPDHSEGLAQDMVVPSNWHLTPDRRTSLTDSPGINRRISLTESPGVNRRASVIDSPGKPASIPELTDSRSNMNKPSSALNLSVSLSLSQHTAVQGDETSNSVVEENGSAACDTSLQSIPSRSLPTSIEHTVLGSPSLSVLGSSTLRQWSRTSMGDTLKDDTSRTSMGDTLKDDTISNTLSNIDIDNTDKSSTASFETAVESLDDRGSDIPPSPRIFRSVTTMGQLQARLDNPSAHSSPQYSASSTAPSSAPSSLCASLGAGGISAFASETVTGLLGTGDTPSSQTCSPSPLRDSNKMAYANKRMSTEIPLKKAKCIQDEADSMSVSCPPNPGQGERVLGPAGSDESFHSCNGMDDCRNAV